MHSKAKLSILFLTMLKIGAFTFGGGYAMMPLIEDEFVDRRKYIDLDEMSNILALAQSIPGAISVNTSIIIGYRQRGFAGGLAAIFGLALPSLITLTIITFLYEQFSKNVFIFAALRGIRACVVALIFSALIRLSKPIEKNIFTGLLFMVSFIASIAFDVKAVYIILFGVVIGLLTSFIKKEES